MNKKKKPRPTLMNSQGANKGGRGTFAVAQRSSIAFGNTPKPARDTGLIDFGSTEGLRASRFVITSTKRCGAAIQAGFSTVRP